MTLLIEHIGFNDAKMVIEAKDEDGHKNLYLKGICMQGGVKNLNERIYSVKEISEAVEMANAEAKKGFQLLSELDHPTELVVSLKNVCASIEKLWMDGNDAYGKLKILTTPSGNIARSLIENGIKLGVSSRGSGNVDANGNVSGFNLTTIDLVATPSAPAARPAPVFEALNSKRGPTIEDLARIVHEDPKAQKYLKKELFEWINKLK